MKVLLISMHSIHATRWINNLNESEYELYWFDVTGKGKIKTLETVTQFVDWKKRKIPFVKGEYWLSKKLPKLYKLIRPFLEVTENEALENIIKTIQPDLIQSFEMQSCSYPILQTMLKFPKTKWLYNCWGNDIYYYQKIPTHKTKVNQVLSRIDYMTSDCDRDRLLSMKKGFKGTFLGVIPTGGGYDLSFFESFREPFRRRDIIIVKGYHHHFGRGLNIIKALKEIEEEIRDYKVVVFGAHKIVEDYVKNHELLFQVNDRHGLKQDEVLKIMGKAAIYIGNNVSDGMPNTLLEAMIMGAFPIQSNPGGATAEIIAHGKNGLLISNPEDVNEIKSLLLQAIYSKEMRASAFEYNAKLAKEKLDYESNKKKIVGIYQGLIK